MLTASHKREEIGGKLPPQELQGEAQQRPRHGSREHKVSKQGASGERPQPLVKVAAGPAAAQRQQQQHKAACCDSGGELQRRKKKAVATVGRGSSGAQSLTALTALGTVALYTAARGGISVFHHLRRKYLRGHPDPAFN